jgi:hypothetical protein
MLMHWVWTIHIHVWSQFYLLCWNHWLHCKSLCNMLLWYILHLQMHTELSVELYQAYSHFLKTICEGAMSAIAFDLVNLLADT